MAFSIAEAIVWRLFQKHSHWPPVSEELAYRHLTRFPKIAVEDLGDRKVETFATFD